MRPVWGAIVVVACSAALASCEREAPPTRDAERGEGLAAVQVLRKGNSAEPETLDPHTAESVPSSNILRDLFEGLIGEAPDGELEPGVAERWEISADGTVYTFYLREDARWSNGDPVTADDFVFSLRRALNPATGSHYSSILAPIQNAEAVLAGELPPETLGAEALNAHTLQIRLRGPTPYFLALLTDASTYPVHRASLERHGREFTRPGKLVSNGAFMLDDWVVQSHIKLLRNPHYWDAANVALDQVWYYPLEDQSAELKRYRAGELDITYQVPLEQIPWIRENLADELIISSWLGTFYFGFNVTRPPFKDAPGLRHALAMAIDREVITGKITAGGELPAYSWVPPVNNYTQQKTYWADWSRDKQLQEARRLYREAGYSEAKPLRVEVLYNTHADYKRITTAIAAMWKNALGVETTLVNQEWKVYLQTMKQHSKTQVFRAGWIGDYNDANSFAELMLTGHGQNHPGYSNAAYDALLAAAGVEQDSAKRRALLERAEAILLHDLPVIPIYFYSTRRLVKPYVAGHEGNIMDHQYSKDFHIKGERQGAR